ncbi:RNA 2',3'-cyclic phosphodiesterase [Methanosphaera sp.]
MRAFLAIELTNYLKTSINETQQTLRESESARIKYVENENLHLTLKFFGDINERKQKQISRIINQTIDTYNPYTLKLAKIGTFPNNKRPRVIWTGAKDKNKNTINIMKELDDSFNTIGFEKERNITPHITIGRVKKIKDNNKLTKTLNQLKNNYHGKMEVSKICLKSSQLTPNGPIYKTEEEFNL